MVMVCLALSLVRKASQREEMPTPYKLRRADRIFQHRFERSVSYVLFVASATASGHSASIQQLALRLAATRSLPPGPSILADDSGVLWLLRIALATRRGRQLQHPYVLTCT